MTAHAFLGAPRRSKVRTKPRISEPVVLDLLRMADCLVITSTGMLAFPALATGGKLDAVYLVVIALLLVPQVFAASGIYQAKDVLARPRLTRMIVALGVSMACVASLTVLGDEAFGPLSTRVGLWFAYAATGLVALRLVVGRQARLWHNEGRFARRVVVVGSRSLATNVAAHLRKGLDPSIELVGVFCVDGDDDASADRETKQLVGLVRERNIDQVIVAQPWHSPGKLPDAIAALRTLAVDVLVYTPVSDRRIGQCGVAYVGAMPMLRVSARPLTGWSLLAKECEDRLIAALLILVLAPVMLLVALAVRLDSPGPVLFRQKRHGFNNGVIEVLKFRSMHVQAAQGGLGEVTQAKRDDPRVTRVGRWLRRTSLDELPQLFNVLSGQMSLVGPRPHAVAHNRHYGRLIDSYLARHRVKPGITGLAQVKGFRGETDTMEKMQNRISCDLTYIENWSVLLDLYILLSTPFSVMSQKNAH